MVELRVRTGSVTQPRFAGVGFHVSFHQHPATPEHKALLWRRWRELRPSFARVGYLLRDGEGGLEALGDLLVCMKETGTEVYLVTWDPEDLQPGAAIDAYARRIAEQIEHLVRGRGATNLRWYCMTNELSMGRWASMATELERFRAYHQAIHDELHARALPVGLLASDASPVEYWPTIEWAAENMDDITEIYGGHHYFNGHAPEDPAFYAWFLEKLRWGVGIGRSRGKDFILGEFGCAQDGRTIDGRKMDVCVHFGTEKEPLVGIQLAEAAIACMNAGVRALGSWTFTDYPDSYSPTYANRWGSFEWEGECRTRDHYYAYGLLTRYFRGPAAAFAVESDGASVRAGAVRHEAGTWSMAVVNRGSEDEPLSVRLEGEGRALRFRKYVYDPAAVPREPEGRLQDPVAEVDMRGGRLRDSVGAGTLTVYTTA
jgi:hypothetical protein